MAEWNSYEEQRRRQMEENRRKVEELRLHHLSAAVREAAARPKPKPNPRPKPKAPGPGELRRSGRVASLPEQPNYLVGAKQREYRGGYEAYAAAKQKAEELQRRIHGIRWPAFVKPLTHDCATKAGVMGIPKHFIKYLPAHDEPVVVVDEADDEFHMMYNAKHHFLRKEWRGFAAHHDLADGDCLVFQLTDRTKFKVYIIRASSGYGNDKTADDEDPQQPNYLKGPQQRDYEGVYADVIWKGPTDEERAAAAAKAEELQRQIHCIRWPAFVKPITHACASRAIYMTIPKHFTEYLPAHDEPVVLVDEADDESHMMYNASRQGRYCYLSKGWREFAVDYDLENGDCLVFQLIESAKFKVYIFRAIPDYESDQTSDDSEDEQK